MMLRLPVALLASFPLLACALPALAAPDRCHPILPAPANLILDVIPGEAPADLVMEAALARPLRITAVTPRLEGGVLTEDLLVLNPKLDFGDLVDDVARLRVGGEDVSVIAGAEEKRYRLRIVRGELLDDRGKPLRVRPPFTPPTPFTIRRGARLEPDGTGWSVGAGAQVEWRGSPQQPLRLILRDAGMLPVAVPPNPEAGVDLNAGRIAAGANFTFSLRGAGARQESVVYRFCLSNVGGRAIDLEANRLGGGNGQVQLAVNLPTNLVEALSANPTGWQRVWGEPIRLRVLGWSDGRPVYESFTDVTLTRALHGVAFGLAVLLLVFICAGMFKQAWNPFTLYGALIKHAKTGRYSLTSFQTLSWTLLVIFALCFSWYCSGLLMELRADILQLLGIVGGAHVLTRAVEAAQPEPAASASEARKLDLVTDAETGEFDLLRFQMLAFTVFSLGYALFNVVTSKGLPELPQSLFWLMGLGNIAHVAGKLPQALGGSANAPTGALNAFEVGLPTERIKVLQTVLGAAPTGVLDAATRDALVKSMSAKGIYPVGQLTEVVLQKLGVP